MVISKYSWAGFKHLQIYDPTIAQLYLDAGVVLTIIPVIVIYRIQKYFCRGR